MVDFKVIKKQSFELDRKVIAFTVNLTQAWFYTGLA